MVGVCLYDIIYDFDLPLSCEICLNKFDKFEKQRALILKGNEEDSVFEG